MNTVEIGKTIGLQILQIHNEECGDGSCGCGCGPFVSVTTPQAAAKSEDCCEPACGPQTCG